MRLVLIGELSLYQCFRSRCLSIWSGFRFMILGQATIAFLKIPNPSDAREREANSTKKFETHTLVRVRGKLHLFD